jgi:hypothetical protein
MPLIESHFLPRLGVDFNLRYCYEIPGTHPIESSEHLCYDRLVE